MTWPQSPRVINHLSCLAPHAIFVGLGLAGMITLPRALFKPRCSNYTSALLAGLYWDVTSVETIRLLQNSVISDVWKYFSVVVGIFSLNIPFPMSMICSGFPTNLMHFCNVGSTRFKENTKINLPNSLDTLVQWKSVHFAPKSSTYPRWPSLGGQYTAHGGPSRICFPYPVGSDKLIRPIYAHRHIPSL